MPLQQVHLRINDAATGKPTPVRLRVTDSAGNYYPPYGHPAEFATGVGEDVGGNLLLDGKKWAYIDGSCEVMLPPGELTIEATKGPEYTPLRETIQLPPGKLALRFNVERWTDQRAAGWYSGDTRAHFVSPHAALLEAAAEDLAVVNLLAHEHTICGTDGQTYRTYPNLNAFSGHAPCVERDDYVVAVNTHNTHPVLGNLALLHCHRIVYPLTFGGPDATDDWSLSDWCGQCHRKGGLVVWTNGFNPRHGHAGEALANLILGEIDAFELDYVNPRLLRAWYKLLDAGIRVPIVGASAKKNNCTPLGAYRTFAYCPNPEPFKYSVWVEAVRAGRTFVTAGAAFLNLDVNGAGPGDVVRSGNDPVRITAKVHAIEPWDEHDLLVNGKVVDNSDLPEIEYETSAPHGCWIAFRFWGGGRIRAHTSPVYVLSESGKPFKDPAAVELLDGHLVRARQWVESEGRFDNPKSRERLLGIFDAARTRLRSEPEA